MQKQARVTSKGQITVPGEVRRMLGVRAGDRLLFESDGEGFRVNASAFSKYRGIGNPKIGSGRKSIARWLRELRGESRSPSTPIS